MTLKCIILLVVSFFICFECHPKKKPYNGKYLFAEISSCKLNASAMYFGFGKFKTIGKGYEGAIGRLYINQEYRFHSPLFFGAYFNRFNHVLEGKKSNCVGYKLGLNYTRISESNIPLDYVSKGFLYTSRNGSYAFDKLVLNSEVFLNLRLLKRLYLEIGIGLQNGVEHRSYKFNSVVTNRLYPRINYFGDEDGPGWHFRSNYLGKIRLVGCFGKAKK